MRDVTKQLLAELREYPWLRSVAEPLNDPSTIEVESWTEAGERCESPRWESLQLDVQNWLAARVRRLDYDRSQEWNQITRIAREELEPHLRMATDPLVLGQHVPDAVIAWVSWDAVGACIETEYSDLVEPVLWRRLGTWYRIGHFPCDWDGPDELPHDWNGKLPPAKYYVY